MQFKHSFIDAQNSTQKPSNTLVYMIYLKTVVTVQLKVATEIKLNIRKLLNYYYYYY